MNISQTTSVTFQSASHPSVAPSPACILAGGFQGCLLNKQLLATNKTSIFHQTYLPFGSAVSQRPLQWPHRRVGAPLRWEQSLGLAGQTGSSLRSTRPRLPAAAGTDGAQPGTAALRGGRGGGGEKGGEVENDRESKLDKRERRVEGKGSGW